jgi:hypothetical protein
VWPFKKRPTFVEARETFWTACVCLNCSSQKGGTNRRALWCSVKECLRMMLQREPSREEITEVIEKYIPF